MTSKEFRLNIDTVDTGGNGSRKMTFPKRESASHVSTRPFARLSILPHRAVSLSPSSDLNHNQR